MAISVSNSKESFLAFFEKNEDLPLFLKPWYLDACFKDEWEPVLVYKKTQLIGASAIPKSHNRKFFRVAKNKVLFPYLAVWTHSIPNQTYHSLGSREHEVLGVLASHLDSNFDRVNFRLYHDLSNWLPFYWKGFTESSVYTYIVKSSAEKDDFRKAYSASTRQTIKKGLQQGIYVEHSKELSILKEQVLMTFEKKGVSFQADFDYVYRVVNESFKNNSADLLLGKSAEGVVHCAVLIIKDDKMSYYMLGGSNPEMRSSGAVSVVMDYAIESSLKEGLHFNFEGSMLEGVSEFFRSFGATRHTCHKVVKNNSLVFKLRDALQLLR